MTIKAFLKLVEIPTKVASVIPFVTGLAYAYYRYNVFNGQLLIVFFISLICLDMATTAINNYMDYKRAQHREGYNYEEQNAIVRDELKDQTVLITIAMLLTMTIVFGLALVVLTDITVLILGGLAFLVGILYSYGPIPISRTPFGEIFSGVLMGGLIFFITIYIQIIDLGLLRVFYENQYLHLDLKLIEIVILMVIALPLIALIANIMLANNICDIEEDIKNYRYTLPYYIGIKWALHLFMGLHLVAYGAIIFAVILGWLPMTSLLVFITIWPVFQGIREFYRVQDKAKTFVIAVKHFILIGGIYAISIVMSDVIGYLLHR
jgi:1,4-dihydroxy-2-naphthoate polyprenyltransferase